jgi:nucleoside-diphosphate-sugar epimerase
METSMPKKQNGEAKTFLITGGTGFIGAYLAMSILEDTKNYPDARVVLFDRDPDQRRLTGFAFPEQDAKDRYTPVKDRITFVQGDLSVLPHVLAVFDEHEPDSVFHLGALLSAGADANPTMGFQVDLVGTWHVLEAARLYTQKTNYPRNGQPPDTPIKVLFPSTIASFGRFIEGGALLPNETPQIPTTMYGVAKVASERLGEYYSDRKRRWVDFRAVRFPAVIGATRGPGGTTAYSTLMVQEPIRGNPYKPYVGPDTPLDIIYISDALTALLGLHEADAKVFTPQDPLKERRVYNIAGIRIQDGGKTRPPTAKEIADAVAEATSGQAAPITFDAAAQIPDVQSTVRTFGVLDDQAARNDWQWPGAQKGLLEAVKDFAKDVKSYPKRIKPIELFG